MEPIDERANNAWFDYQYTGGPTFERIFKDGFKAGAESEHDMLTKWNDPKEPPQLYENVLVKYYGADGCEHIAVAWRAIGDSAGYNYIISRTDVTINSQDVIGWREIPE